MSLFLEEGSLRVHGMVKESLALQKGAIKDNLLPQTSLYFISTSLNPGNPLRYRIYFTSCVKICLSTPTHGNYIFFQTTLAQEGKIE